MVAAFGFCEYEFPEATLRCIRLLNEWLIADKKLVVGIMVIMSFRHFQCRCFSVDSFLFFITLMIFLLHLAFGPQNAFSYFVNVF